MWGFILVNIMKLEKFSHEICEHLKWYVYRLVDPRDGMTFYVGRGINNRIFDHVNGFLTEQDEEVLSLKMKQIRDIQLANLNVIHIIHRHGLENKSTAEIIEASLIDAYPGLTNIMNGKGSNEYGVANIHEIISSYQAETVDIDDNALLISINRTAIERGVYDAVRFAWKLTPSEAKKAKIILATVQGVIKGVFIAKQWLEATEENFPNFMLLGEEVYNHATRSKRYGFIGEEAPQEFQEKYLGKRIPDKFRKKGASNPVKYSWKAKD